MLLFVNIAGRERMLLQKITKEVLLRDKNSVAETMRMFDDSLEGLLKGGMVQNSLFLPERVFIDKLDNSAIRRDLENIQLFWMDYKNKMNLVLFENDTEALRYIIANNDIFLEKIDDIVNRIQQYYEYRGSRIRIVFFILTGFVISGFLTAILLQAKDLSTARLALAELETFVPICSRCKKIRKENSDPHDSSSWLPLEEYFKRKTDTEFSHGLCPDCMQELYPEYAKNSEKKGKGLLL